jgi:YVTN family beta-propeller protein
LSNTGNLPQNPHLQTKCACQGWPQTVHFQSARIKLLIFIPVKSSVKIAILSFALLSLTALDSRGQITTANFFNWETAPVHPVALSPDGTRLVVCNLPDARVEVFDVTSGLPVALGSIPVGLDPVTVRFRTTNELWVANYISDSVSIIDLPTMRVVNTITTQNEPSDIVFAGAPQTAYVSCGQPNLVQVFDPATLQGVTNLVIDGNRPRAMDVSPDGAKVYVAIFESGNASTIIGTGVSQGVPRANPVNFPFAPSGGLNPEPNSGTNFYPAINPLITNAPPKVSLIVKKNSAGRWMDDNNGDWTEFIRGTNAAFTGRVPGWDMPDHDLAVIDTTTFSINYANGLMNICMGVGVNPVTGKISVIGTDALNQIRFQSALDGIFIRVNLAQVDPATLTNVVTDLNPHLNYSTPQVSQTERNKSLGDPRGIIWSADGTRGYVTGMGSDNLAIIDANGNRAGITPAIDVGQGPTGMALDESRNRLYVYNRFDGSISTVDTASQAVTNTLSLFDPTPQSIKAGRPRIYNTHLSSGLGQAACASCHVDTRFDRLAWDLGQPSDPVKTITNANFVTTPATTNNYHPMKGPMTTQTFQDIIGHEPFHWRGDRDGIEQFDSTFTNLQASPTGISTNEMTAVKNFLATIRFAPNPYRNFDNSLPTNLVLPGQFALGRGVLAAGTQLPDGNAQNGQALFRQTTTIANSCTTCHTLPTGLGTDMHFNGAQWLPVALGTNSAHHIGLIELERTLQLPFKVAQLRNLFDKSGMDYTHTNSRAGFGFSHDGSVDSLPRFIQDAFAITNDQNTADLVAFLFSFTGSDLIPGAISDGNHSPGVASLDTPASVGRQITISNSPGFALITNLITLANSSTSRVDLVVKGFENGIARGWFYNRTNGNFQSDRLAELESPAALGALAAAGAEQTYTVVPRGAGWRMGIDRDADGYLDRDELDFGSDPANALSLATNTPPVLSAATNLTVLKGRLLVLNFTAADADIPAQMLTFSLTNSPPDAVINSTNGIFAWTPSGPVGSLTNSITVVVTDNGNPNRSTSETFTIVAADLSASAPTVTTIGITIGWSAIPGLNYRLQYKNNLTDATWTDLPGDIAATNTIALKTDSTTCTNASRFYRIIALP